MIKQLMKRRRYLSTRDKVRELVRLLGSKRAVVHAIGAASRSSVKRWLRNECQPIAAHVNSVNGAYQMAKRMSGPLLKNLRREAEMQMWRAKLGKQVVRDWWKLYGERNAGKS